MTSPQWFDALPARRFPDGVDILVEGQPAPAMYVLVEGELRVHVGGLQIDLVRDPGTVLGEMAALLGGAPRATVTTVGPCVLHTIDDPQAMMATEPALTLAIARRVAHRLDLITGYLDDLRRQYSDRPDHLGIVVDVLQTLMVTQRMPIEPGSVREPDAPY